MLICLQTAAFWAKSAIFTTGALRHLWHPAADGVAAAGRRTRDRTRRALAEGGTYRNRGGAPRADRERAARRDGHLRLPDGGRCRRQALRPDAAHPSPAAGGAQGAAAPARSLAERHRVRRDLHPDGLLLP